MVRAKKIKKRKVQSDLIYADKLVGQLINLVMKDGKKELASRLVYSALDQVKKKLKTDDPVQVFQQAVNNIKPNMEVRSRRVGGAAYQVPVPVRGSRKESLALRWLVRAARSHSNKDYHTYDKKLAAEIIEAYNKKGKAVEKKEETHRMAEANKAFSHFRW